MDSSGDVQIQTLIQALDDTRDGLRQFAMRRLLALGPRITPAVIQLLGDKRDDVQECAAIMLTTMGPSVIPQLITAMKGKDRHRAWGAAWVLATLNPDARAALPPVNIPIRNTEKQAEIWSAPQAGIWSDAWLTKVRQKLFEARAQVVHILAAFEASPDFA